MRGAAVGAERADVENGKQVQTMQLGRRVKPRLSRMARQMRRWLWALLGARRLGWDTNAPLAGVALKQAEMWLFRRRTGHEGLLSSLSGQQSTMILVRSG